jgi:hypothetical protein
VDFKVSGVEGHFDIGRFPAVKFNMNVIPDLAVSQVRDRRLIGINGDEFDLSAYVGRDELFKGSLGQGVIPGKGGLKDIIPTDIDDVFVRGKLDGVHGIPPWCIRPHPADCSTFGRFFLKKSNRQGKKRRKIQAAPTSTDRAKEEFYREVKEVKKGRKNLLVSAQ